MKTFTRRRVLGALAGTLALSACGVTPGKGLDPGGDLTTIPGGTTPQGTVVTMATSTPSVASVPVATSTPVATPVPAVSSSQRIAASVKPAVVRVYEGAQAAYVWQPTGKVYTVSRVSSGSGFFINPSGYIVTNAHVTALTKTGPEALKAALFRRFVEELARDYQDDARKVLANTDLMAKIARQTRLQDFRPVHHVQLAGGALFPFEIKAFGTPVGEGSGKDVAVIKIEIKHTPTLKLGDSDKLQILDPVMAVGYPGAADMSEYLNAASRLEATFTRGEVSAKKQSPSGAPLLQHSADTNRGSSGGPVLNEKGEVVGITTFGPDEQTSITYAEPTSTILEFVRQAGVTNEEGPTDQRYREGLAHVWSGEHRAAITKFEEVRRLFPQHSEIETLLRECQEAML